jgi:hypothetical protein
MITVCDYAEFVATVVTQSISANVVYCTGGLSWLTLIGRSLVR